VKKYFNIKIFVYILLGYILVNLNYIFAQKVFLTKKGEVIASSKYLDTMITAKSNDLLIQLDYENARVKMTFKLNTFKTGVDSLDEQIKSISLNELYFDGKLGIDLISTKRHLTQKFDFNGNLYTKSVKTVITGKGELEHISENNEIVACMLWLAFKLDIKKIKWDLKSYGVNDSIQVEIIQALLKKVQ
jgi:hypothetical protein